MRLNIDHERFPKQSPLTILQRGDLQLWNGHFLEIVDLRWSKTGKILNITWRDGCKRAGHTPTRWACHPGEFEWGRQRRSTTIHAVYRPVTIIHEDPL